MSQYTDMVLRDRDHREVAQVAASLADFLCWAAGHNAALHQDEKADRGIVGVVHVRRARELLDHLVVVDRPVPQAESREQEGLWITDDRELDVVAVLRAEISQRLQGGPGRSEGAIHIVVIPDGPPYVEGERRPEQPAQGAPAGWVVSPAERSGDVTLFDSFKACAQHITDMGGDVLVGRVPRPLYEEPRGPAKPAEGIVGWMVRQHAGPDVVYFEDQDTALDWQREAKDDYTDPAPVYGQSQPALEPDWPRSIPPEMAEAYGETMSLALQGGADHPQAAKAVLEEFMRSHRPGPLAPAQAWTLPAGFVAMPEEISPGQRRAVEAEADKLVGNETADERNARSYRALVASRPRVDPVPNRVVEADFAEVPVGWLAKTDTHTALLLTEAAARDWFGPSTRSVVPVYAAPHPAVLPPGFVGMPETLTDAMVLGFTAALRMSHSDDTATQAKRLYDAFVINRPRMPG